MDAFYLSIAPLSICVLTFAAVAEARFVPLLARMPGERHRELDSLGTKYAVGATAVWLVLAAFAQVTLARSRIASLPLTMAIESPAILTYGVYAVNRSVLLANNRMSIANLAAAAGTACGVLLILVVRRPLTMPFAFVLASWVQAAICFVAVEITCRRPSALRLARHVGLARLSLAVVLSTSATTVDRFVASPLGSGAVTAMTIADRLYQVPATIATATLSNAVFPALAHLRSEPDFGRFVERALGLSAAVTLPIAAAGVLFAPDALHVVAGRAFVGSGTEARVVMTVALLFVAVPLYTQSVLYTRVLLAVGEERSVASQGVLAFFLNAIGDLIGALVLGLPGIAVATSATYIICDIYLISCLRRKSSLNLSIKRLALGNLNGAAFLIYGLTVVGMISVRLASLGLLADIGLASTLTLAGIAAMLGGRRALTRGRAALSSFLSGL